MLSHEFFIDKFETSVEDYFFGQAYLKNIRIFSEIDEPLDVNENMSTSINSY